MWVFLLLVAGFFVASMVLTTEVRKLMKHTQLIGRLRRAWRALSLPIDELAMGEMAPVRIERVSVPTEIPSHANRWCRRADSEVIDRCQTRRRRPRTEPLRSEIISTATVSSMPPSGLYAVSRPGELVRPEAYSQAPPLPDDGSEITIQDLGGSGSWSGMSVEIDLDDLEDLVDTRPSVALTAAEAEVILEKAASLDAAAEFEWDSRDTQRKPTTHLEDIPQEAPTGRGLLSREGMLAG